MLLKSLHTRTQSLAGSWSQLTLGSHGLHWGSVLLSGKWV